LPIVNVLTDLSFAFTEIALSSRKRNMKAQEEKAHAHRHS